MKRSLSFRAAAVVALLLPGLVMAAPIAGPCGLCGGGDDCHMQQRVQPEAEIESCCETESEAPPEPSLGSSSCECGREAPPALTAESPTTVDTAFATTAIQKTISSIVSVGAAYFDPAYQAAPPPSPPAYLIDCAFLT